MARKSRQPKPTDAFEDFESWGDRAIDWLGANAKAVLGTLAVLLLISAAYGYYDSSRNKRENRAASALAAARSEYLVAMGAAPDALEAPELANPEAAVAIRAEFIERFREVAKQYPGAVGGALAQLEAGDLSASSGDAASALESWRAAIDALPPRSALRGFVYQRIGRLQEDAGDWEAAAAAHEAASEIAAYELHQWAMADAARCYLGAGQTARALDLAGRIELEGGASELPDHIRGRLKEARAAAED